MKHNKLDKMLAKFKDLKGDVPSKQLKYPVIVQDKKQKHENSTNQIEENKKQKFKEKYMKLK